MLFFIRGRPREKLTRCLSAKPHIFPIQKCGVTHYTILKKYQENNLAPVVLGTRVAEPGYAPVLYWSSGITVFLEMYHFGNINMVEGQSLCYHCYKNQWSR